MRYALLYLLAGFGLGDVAVAQPQEFYSRYEAGRAQLDQSQFEAAVATLTGALNAVPAGQVPDANIYVALGYAQMRLGNLDEADRNFNFAQQELNRLTPTSRQQLQVNWDVLKKLRGH